MYKLFVVVLALATLRIEGRPHGEEVEFECNGQPDGYYADLSDKASFFSCYEGQLIAKVLCEHGFEFDGVESCVPVQARPKTVETQEQEQEQEIADYLQQYTDLSTDENENSEYGEFRNETSKPKLVVNIEITKNIFPRSLVIIGKANREQKNK